jgi:TolB protein
MEMTGRPLQSRRADSKHRRAWYVVAGAVLCLFSTTARAQLTIEVIGGGADQVPITVLPLADEEKFQQRISQIVSADLVRSGRFKVQDIGSVRPLPSEPTEVNYRYWKNRGTQTLVIGKVIQRDDGKVEVRFRMMDTSKEAQAVGYAYTIVVPQMRAIAHKIADTIYEKLIGEPGVFSTRIAYVARFPQRFELHVADADGFNSQFILAHREPIISPAWSPDGTRIAYVSFEQGRSMVFIHNLVDGTRRILASYDGINSAPAWSPDGKRLALALSKDGVSQIYVIDADGNGLVRLTNSNAIDTEASFSPDGKYILFTSDRGGSPQIYRMSASGANVERMTFDGGYNVTPRYSPDGKAFAYIQRNQGRYMLALMDLTTRQSVILSDSSLDGSPAFAPNGRLILYASIVGGHGILAAVSSDGRIKQKISASALDVREPAWGPLVGNR